MSMIEFAENELNLLLNSCTDEESKNVQKVVNKDILDIIRLFSEQGHSGFSAHYSMNILKRLMNYKPLSPITDDESEWNRLDYDDDLAYQCKRCPSLFKDKDGRVYNVEGRVFSDDNGHSWFTNGNSRVYVDLPYSVPDKPEYVVIDNQVYRSTTLATIINSIGDILNKYNLPSNINIETITEDTIIEDLLDRKYFDDLETILFDKYYVSKPISRLNSYDKPAMWNLINIIMNSDKDEPVKVEN